MATGHLRKRINTKGGISYQITAEGECDPLTGKRERKYKTITGTKKQAEAELRKMIADLESGSVITASAMKLSNWMASWLSTYLPNIEQTTKDGYQEKIDNYINPTLGHLPIKAIKPDNIQLWINGLSKRGLSPKTIRNAYNNLNAALKKAVILRMIPFNPCEGTVLPKLQKYQAKVYDVPTIQEALAAAEDLPTYLIILLGAGAGLRRGEMAALQWKHIDFAKSTISVVQSRVHTKNSVVQKAPKSEAGNRTIKIGPDVLADLKETKAAYDNAVATKAGYKDLGYIICKENGEPFHPDSITQKWRRFLAKQKLPHIRVHDLRHSNATALIAAGVSPKVVQHRLGHANVSITLNTYTHVLPSMDEEAAEKLDNALFSTAQPISHPPIII